METCAEGRIDSLSQVGSGGGGAVPKICLDVGVQLGLWKPYPALVHIDSKNRLYAWAHSSILCV